nr:heat stress transcription factor A-7A-like isoform X2 [Ipomoea batatas]
MKLSPEWLQEIMWFVRGSSTISYVLIKKGGGLEPCSPLTLVFEDGQTPSSSPRPPPIPPSQRAEPPPIFAAMEAEQKGGIIILDLDNNPSETSGNDSGATKEKMEAPFVRKTYDMVNNIETDSIVSWNSDGSRLVVWDVHKFAAEILPTYFRHSNPSSFFCQLNSYVSLVIISIQHILFSCSGLKFCLGIHLQGFRKSDWDRWEFQHQWFQRGKKIWLNKIKRRTTRSSRRAPIPLQDQQQKHQPPHDEETSGVKAEEEIKEMLDEQNGMKMEIKHLQENQVILAKKLASIREADTLDVKGRKLFLLMAQDFLESTKGKIPVEEESPNSIQENKEWNDVLARSDTNSRSESHTTLEKLVEEGEDIMIGIEYLLEGPADWEDYVKKLEEKGAGLKTRPMGHEKHHYIDIHMFLSCSKTIIHVNICRIYMSNQ